MANTNLDVIGVGNAIVDVLADAPEAFISDHGIPRGGMELIDAARAKTIYDAMAQGVEISGGSAANSIACVASFGGRGGFVGKVADDALGATFRDDLRKLGVAFDTPPLTDGAGTGTGRCLINVTPDAQRSMSTFLGAAGEFASDDVNADFVGQGAIVFFEGYLFEQPVARQAFIKASQIANSAGRKAAITLSDSGCVERNKDAFKEFISNHVDILLANHLEAEALFGTDDEQTLIAAARDMCPLSAVTRAEKGSLLIPRDGDPIYIQAVPPAQLIGTTGAGDAYAAGLLFGIATGRDLETAGKLGSLAAAEVISHYGARPEQSLKAMAEAAGLI